MLRVLYGEEPYGVKYFLNSEIRKLGLDESEIIRTSITADGLIEDMYSFGLFGRKYFIVSAPDLKNPVLEKLLVREPEHEIRVVVDALDKRLSIYGRLEKEQKLKIFNRLTADEFERFLLGKLQGTKITKADFDYLVSRIGYVEDDEVSLYSAEIYAKQIAGSSEIIQRDLIDLYVPVRTKENGFKLFTYYQSNDKVAFFSLLLQLIDNGENEINLLSTLLYSFRISYKIALVGREKAQFELHITPYQIKSAADIDTARALDCINLLTDGIRSIKQGIDAKTALIRTTTKLF